MIRIRNTNELRIARKLLSIKIGDKLRCLYDDGSTKFICEAKDARYAINYGYSGVLLERIVFYIIEGSSEGYYCNVEGYFDEYILTGRFEKIEWTKKQSEQ